MLLVCLEVERIDCGLLSRLKRVLALQINTQVEVFELRDDLVVGVEVKD